MRVLAIGAHPADIEIACSGTLANCVKRGDTVIVCHVSTGNLGHVVIPPDELTKIRAAEAKKAVAMRAQAEAEKEKAVAARQERIQAKEEVQVRLAAAEAEKAALI